MLLMHWIPSIARTFFCHCPASCRIHTHMYTHTCMHIDTHILNMKNVYGFLQRCSSMQTQNTMETRCYFRLNTVLKWQLLKSWYLNWLLLSWLRCDGVGLPCSVQTYSVFLLFKMRRQETCFSFPITVVCLPHALLCLFFGSFLHFLLPYTTHFYLCPQLPSYLLFSYNFF